MKIRRPCAHRHFLNACSRCTSVINNFSMSLTAFSDLYSIFMPSSLSFFFFSYVSNHQEAVFGLWTGRVHLAEIPSPSATGIFNYHAGPGRRENIAEDTSFNIQPYFKVRRCQSATPPDALAQLCAFVDALSWCHLVSEAPREGAAEVQLWRLIHWFIRWRVRRLITIRNES